MKNNFIVKTIKKETIEVEGRLIKPGAKKQPTIKELIYGMNERMNHEFKQIHGEFKQIHNEFGKVHGEIKKINQELGDINKRLGRIEATPTMQKELAVRN